MKRFMSLRLRHLVGNAGWLKLGLVILAGWLVNAANAQNNFASALVLSGDWGSVTNSNAGVTPDSGAPNIAGFRPHAPLWYQWTATADGEVELDTVGSFNTSGGSVIGTSVNGTPLNTVLGVFTGTNVVRLNQVAANDNLFPLNSSYSSIGLSMAQINESGCGEYAMYAGPGGSPYIGYLQPYYGPSHLRFNAKGATTYYIAVDSQNANSFLGYSLGNGPGTIILNWAYKSSGVFRFATEDMDYWTGEITNAYPKGGGGHLTGYPFYQCSQYESQLPSGTANDANSTILTYYQYNVPGLLVTVTRVAGSAGRAMVDYQTTNWVPPLPMMPSNAMAVAGLDYVPVSGTLVFDDYEMSKNILIPIISHYYADPWETNQPNRVFGVQLSNPRLDPRELVAGDVATPRLDTNFSLAMVKILNVNADPYGLETISVVWTNGFLDAPTNSMPNLVTNYVPPAWPTNVIINFRKAHYRVPADVQGSSGWTRVVIYAERFGTNTAATSLNYRINNDLGYDQNNREEMNNQFPLQPGSDYAVPTPPMALPIRGTNSDFDLAQGTLSFPANGAGVNFQPISFTVTNSDLRTKFNKDFKIQLYHTITVGGRSVPALLGMVAETTVTILFDDQKPPAGSVDELYNADFNTSLALPADQVPQTTPQNNPNPGVGIYGLVNSLLVLTNNKALIAGDFGSYNGSGYLDAKPVNCIALIDANGDLDASFEPDSGASGPIYSLAASPGSQFVIGGDFLSFNGVSCSHVARLNADGSLDTAFNPATDGTVWAAAVQPDGRVLIGGDFNTVNGQPRNYLARLNIDGTLDTAFNPGALLNGPVYAIALPPVFTLKFANSGFGESNQTVNLGSATAGTVTVNYNMYLIQADDMQVFYGDTNVAAGTGVLIYDTGSVFGTGSFTIPFGPIGGLTTNVITIVMDQGAGSTGNQWKYDGLVTFSGSGTGIMVGGNFSVSGQSYADIARFNTSGTLDATFNPVSGADNPIYALARQFDGQILAGGSFTHFNGISMNRIARLNMNGSLDTTNFLAGSGANDVVWNILPQLDGTIYVGGQFSSFNGTHRLGFTRLYADGTVDTTFLDTAYNQFAGLKRIYAHDAPAVYASGVQSDGNIIIGGTFQQVGGGQANTNVCNTLDDELGYPQSFGDTNLWVEPKTRDGVRNRSGVARLIGGSTPGPGNIGFQTTSYSVNKSQSALTVGLVRTNGFLGPISANFSVQAGTAQSGTDFYYNNAPPVYWVAWDYITRPTRTHGEGLYGVSGFLRDIYEFLTLSDSAINKLSAVTVSVIKNTQILGDLNADFQLANPSGADMFYLGGQNIPLGAALGPSAAPFTVIDDVKSAGVVGFKSATYSGTNIANSILLVRSNGIYGTVTVSASTITNGSTAVAYVDYLPITNLDKSISQGNLTNSFAVTNLPNGLISTNFIEKFVNLRLSNLRGPSDGGATWGRTNAVLRLINPQFQGYLTLSATNYTGTQNAGFVNFVVNRVAGSFGTVTVDYATTNGTAVAGTDYYQATNTLQWNNGDASPRTVAIPLINTGTVGTNKQFGVLLSNPKLNNVSTPALFYIGTPPTNSITNATLTISNDNSYGQVQFSAANYLASESGGYATITVIRTGGSAGPVSVNFATSNGSNTAAGVNYIATNGVLVLTTNQSAASFDVRVLNDAVQNPTNFYFKVTLSNPTNAALGSPTNAAVNLLDAQTYDWPPGGPDGIFTAGMNGDVFALALQPNGQILAGGNFTYVNGAPDSGIARLNTDGSLDVAGFDSTGANGAVQAVVCQTDGRVLIGGAFTTAAGIARTRIARLMTDGSLDSSFNPGPGADSTVYALVETFISGVRKIYAGGVFYNISDGTSPNFARLNNGGALDPDFNIGNGPNAAVFAVAVYPTNSAFAGKVLIGGAFTNFNGVTVGHLARLNGDGSLDTNFSSSLGADATVRAIAIQTDGRVLIGGDFTNVNGVASGHMARLNAVDGSVDTSFAANIGAGANDPVQAITVQADNRIVLAGQFTLANGVIRNRLTRLLPNGAVDTSVNFGTGANGSVAAVVIQPADQKLVIGGAFTQFDDVPHAHIARIYGGSMTGSGLFQFTSAAYQASESSGQALITVRRTGGTSGPNADGSGNISVQFATANGTAVAGVNYTTVLTNLSFPPGEVLASVGVPLIRDGVITSNLTVSLAITNPTAPAGIGAQPVAWLTIVNDDSAVSFSNATYTVNKNVPGGFALIDVIRIGTTNGTCSVDFITTTNGDARAGEDYQPTNVTLTFNPGDSVRLVQVPILNNPLAQNDRTVMFTLTNAVDTVVHSPSNAMLTIRNTDIAPGRLCFSATNYSAYESDGSAYITVVRTNGTSGPVSVTYQTVELTNAVGAAHNGVNYITTSGTLSFNDGDSVKMFAVPLINNSVVEGNVSLSVILSNPTGGATLVPPTNATLVIADNDSGFKFAAATNTIVETSNSVSVNVLRIGPAAGAAQVNYATANGTAVAGVNYLSTSGTLAFGNGETLRAIVVPLISNTNVTGDLTFTIALSSPSPGYIVTVPGTNTVVIWDANTGISFTNSAVTVMKNSGSVRVAVVCSNPRVIPVMVDSNSVPLTVFYFTADGTAVANQNYVPKSGTLYFTNGIGTNTFDVTIINNSLVSGDCAFTVNLSNPNPVPLGQVIPPGTQTITIVDNNVGLRFSRPTYSVLKSGVAATITVLRTSNTNKVSSVDFATANGTATAGLDYVATNGTFVFTNGVTSNTFVVPIINNTVVQPDKTVLLRLFNPVNGILIAPYAATLTIHDTSGSFVVPAGSTLIGESFQPPNGIIDPGEKVSLMFGFRVAGGTNVANLTATLLETTGVTPSPTNYTQSYGILRTNGPAVYRQFTFTASGTNSQQIMATFKLEDGTKNLGTNHFTFTLGTWTTTFSNTAAIIINDYAIASPYPSIINVSNLGGVLIKATITLTNLSHGSLNDVDALLVSPAGQDTLLMAGVGTPGVAATHVTLTFDDAATNSLPSSGTVTSGTNKPTAYPPLPIFP